MKLINIIGLCAITFCSCENKCDKAVSHLEKWFNSFDSARVKNNNSKKYYKSIDYNAKEIAIESIIDQQMDKHPDKQNIEFKNISGNTQSYYEWDSDDGILRLDVYYTDPTKTPGLRYELTVTKK